MAAGLSPARKTQINREYLQGLQNQIGGSYRPARGGWCASLLVNDPRGFVCVYLRWSNVSTGGSLRVVRVEDTVRARVVEKRFGETVPQAIDRLFGSE